MYSMAFGRRIMRDNKVFTEANRKAWNCAMPYHRKAKDSYWDQCFTDGEFIHQEEPELSALKELKLKAKAIVHLCCNNGLELMSLKRMGAGRCVGFDICDEAIKDAKKRSEKFQIETEFYRSSVYDIGDEFFAKFDLVYITIGALTWLPDLKAFFGMVRSLLKKGGKLFIYEQHPFAMVLPWDVSATMEKPIIENNYFYDDYQVYQDGLDYYGNENYSSPDTYEFLHTISDIINAIITNGLRIKQFNEYEHDISNGLAWVQKTGMRLPLSYILIADAE